MHISIQGHHISITEAIQNSVNEKMAKVLRHYDHINSMKVMLSVDNHHTEKTHKGHQSHVAEALIRVPGKEIFVQASGDDMYSSIAEMAQKLDRKIRKLNNKINKKVRAKASRFAPEPNLIS